MICVNKNNSAAYGNKVLIFLLVLFLILSCSAKALGASKPDKDTLTCRKLRSMSRVYMAYGEYSKASPLAEQALDLAKDAKVEDGELASCLIDLGYLYGSQGKLLEAEHLLKSGLQLQEKTLYKNHPYIAYTIRNLAVVYRKQAQFEQAELLLGRAMKIMSKSHPGIDEVLAPFQADLGKVFAEQGKYEDAEDYYQKALNSIYKSYGHDHLYTAGVLGDLARVYTSQQRYAEAEELIKKVLAVQGKVYGKTHHLLAPALLTYAEICQAKGQTSQAEQLIQRALSATQKTADIVAIAKLQQRIIEIRDVKSVVYEPLAKADR